MNRLLIRQLARPILRRATPALPSHFRRPLADTFAPPFNNLYARTVASTVTTRPASQTFEHAATNIKEEVGNSAADLAKVIASANVKEGKFDGSASFLGITSLVAHEVPKPILMLGLAGTVPYVAAGATTVYLAHEASLAARGIATNIDPGVALTIFDQALNAQVTYGAVILSFLGALHWGMEIAGYGGVKGYSRLALGAAPVIVAWSSLGLEPMTALIVQWVGFTGMWWADARASSWGWTPQWYSQYRFYLSILVGTCIIGSLAGTSYYGPVAGHGLLAHDLDLLREEREKLPPKTGFISLKDADVELTPTKGDDDYFMKIHRKEHKVEAKEEGKEIGTDSDGK